jgi:murein hydrolase activator
MFRAFLLGIILLATPAYAADDLKALKKQLKEENAKQEVLQQQAREIESEIKDTRGKLLKTGASIQENEKDLKRLNSQIAELQVRKKVIDEKLLRDRQSMARLTLALERLRRVPPEALIARPGAPLEAAQSALLMREIMPTLYHQAEELKKNLAELQVITDDLNAKKEKALGTSKKLKAEHDELAVLVDKREHLYTATAEDLQERKANVKRISSEASNLQDLVRRLNDEDRPRKQAGVGVKPPKAGQARLPVTGIITVGYGDPDNFGADSRGLTIEGQDDGLVVAPMGGVVRFAGTFKNYGQLVIIEHDKGYHSLIAGLKKIDTVVGQSVAAGEPIGLLNRASNGSKPTLYYELRLNGQPVNPANKFTDSG